jgi:hypothetical protein
LYRLAKQIDNYRGEGTWLIYTSRVVTFFGLVRRQFFYEPLGDYEAVLGALNYVSEQREVYSPDDCVDHVAISFAIFEGADSAPNGRLQIPKSGEQSRGLHAVQLVGWEDAGEVVVFRNSWGAGWGDRGYGRMDRRYLDAYMYDAWLHRNARFGLTRHTYDKYHAATTPGQRRAVLLQDNPRWRGRIRYAGMNYQLIIYETLSINDGRPAEIIELRNRHGVRVGAKHFMGPVVVESLKSYLYGRHIVVEGMAPLLKLLL